ncbi:bacterio-opsin activator domain-containing protein [Halomicroarcula sp. GCM10025894]|uniref:bacterio-opsin activator domain-containing protein n=1 Tax=Halomicroarcula sp. GCM10025894 TaxID=3252673 RepID=UPI0036129260
MAPVAWAGDADGYVDTTLAGETTGALPAVRAARDLDPVSVPKISSHVFDEPWAKDALSYSFSSVLSTPLVYDDVLYGVLTVYSCTEGAFDTLYDNFVTDVATLLVNYSRILEQREAGSQQQHTTLEFELTGQTYPLQRLANATDSTVQFDTVAEHTPDDVRILATVLEGDAEAVLDHAQSMASIDTASWFGSADHRQLSLVVRKPFLATLVGKHGGRLVETVSKPDVTAATIELPDSVSKRPLLDSLTSRYDRIELLAQRHSADPAVGGQADLTDVLTERQSEILNAAYHGGYYETPRGVTGEDLAASFGISSPAVYNHLQAAHRRILRTVLDVGAGTDD